MISGATDQSMPGAPGQIQLLYCPSRRGEPLKVALGYPEPVSVAVVYAGAGFNYVVRVSLRTRQARNIVAQASWRIHQPGKRQRRTRQFGAPGPGARRHPDHRGRRLRQLLNVQCARVQDGISFEQLGRPAVVLCTEPFDVTSRSITSGLSLPDSEYRQMPHPLGNCTLQRCYSCRLGQWLPTRRPSGSWSGTALDPALVT